LDAARPFTAARARNEGFEQLIRLRPHLKLIQFVDGDCEVMSAWIDEGQRHLRHNPTCGIVAGRLRERFPDRSIYNRLCDMEWDRPLGDSFHVGGIFMVRRSAFEAAGRFRTDLIAAEEDEFCVRLRGVGFSVQQISADMALHDADMTRFGQWWVRAVRSGHAAAQGITVRTARHESLGLATTLRAWGWGFALPLVGCSVSWVFWPWGLCIFLVYPVQVLRIALRGRRSLRDNLLTAVFMMVAKFAQVAGQLRFLANALLGKAPKLIEYRKTTANRGE
jgi:hypothetical protein